MSAHNPSNSNKALNRKVGFHHISSTDVNQATIHRSSKESAMREGVLHHQLCETTKSQSEFAETSPTEQ